MPLFSPRSWRCRWCRRHESAAFGPSFCFARPSTRDQSTPCMPISQPRTSMVVHRSCWRDFTGMTHLKTPLPSAIWCSSQFSVRASRSLHRFLRATISPTEMEVSTSCFAILRTVFCTPFLHRFISTIVHLVWNNYYIFSKTYDILRTTYNTSIVLLLLSPPFSAPFNTETCFFTFAKRSYRPLPTVRLPLQYRYCTVTSIDTSSPSPTVTSSHFYRYSYLYRNLSVA